MELWSEYSDFIVACLACIATMLVGCCMGISIERGVRKLDDAERKGREEAEKMMESRERFTRINLN